MRERESERKRQDSEERGDGSLNKQVPNIKQIPNPNREVQSQPWTFH